MTKQPSDSSSATRAPEAVVIRKKSGFSIVWLVPLVAALLGGWLVYKALSEKGPVIKITFETAEGIEAGKTKIKYKDVDVGEVQQIELDDHLEHVIVTAELVKRAKGYLTEDAQFWVVKARVAAGQVSGLGTLFSGVYIGMEPGRSGASARHFKGLETPPVLTKGLPGRHFLLRTKTLGSLDFGSPVFFRKIEVGKVVAYELQEDGRFIDVKIFVKAPHHERVRKNTRFWNASGLDVSLDANGIRVNTESFVSMMIGGVAFETPDELGPGEPAQDGDVFTLYESRGKIYEKTYTEKNYFVLHFADSVRGLRDGAPVEFRGIRIGEVLEIKALFDLDKLTPRNQVLIATEPERWELVGKSKVDQKERMEKLVEKGLRAQLKTGSLLTGQLFVDINLFPDAPPARITYGGKYPELPTVPAPLEEITTSVAHLLDKLETLPIEQMGADLHDTIRHLDGLIDALEDVAQKAGKDIQDATRGVKSLVASSDLTEAAKALNATLQQTEELTRNLSRDVAPGIDATLEQLQRTLVSIEKQIGADSALMVEMRRAMTELAGAARSIRGLADYLERHPDALLRGKGGK